MRSQILESTIPLRHHMPVMVVMAGVRQHEITSIHESARIPAGRLHRVAQSTYLLVVLSAVTHAYWNFLLKRNGATQAVVGLSKIVEAAAFGLVLLSGVPAQPAQLLNAWKLPLFGASLVLLNYLFLSAAYRAGDLSLGVSHRARSNAHVPSSARFSHDRRKTPAGRMGRDRHHHRRHRCATWKRTRAGRGRDVIRNAGGVNRGVLHDLGQACDSNLSPLAYYAAYTVIVGIAYGWCCCEPPNQRNSEHMAI